MNKFSDVPQIIILVLLVVTLSSVVLNSNLDISSITGMDVYSKALPTVTDVKINSTFGGNTTRENLTMTWIATDDATRVVNISRWIVDGEPLALVNLQFERNGTFNASDYSGRKNIVNQLHNMTWLPDSGWEKTGAYFFNTSRKSYINISGGPSGNRFMPTGITLEARINFTTPIADTAYSAIITKATNTGPISFFMLNTNNWEDIFLLSHKYGIACGFSDGSWSWSAGSSSSGDVLSPGKWYHVVCVYGDGYIKAYVNGVLKGTYGGNNLYFSTGPVVIGALDNGAALSGFFNGTIDSVRIYNRSLSYNQIKLLNSSRDYIIDSNDTTQGQKWQACMTPNDGTGDGITVCSNNISIIPPGIYNITAIATSNQTATISWNTVSLANATVRYKQTKNLGINATNASFIRSRQISVTGLKNNTLYYYNVTSFDRYENFETNGTFNFTTSQNEFPPVVNRVILNSTNRRNLTTENLTVYWNSTDQNNDRIINITDWRLNGKSLAVLNMWFENNTQGKNITDYSSFGNNGTIKGTGITFSNNSGYSGSGTYSFDGDGSNITIPGTASLKPKGNFTIAFWMKRHTAVSSDCILNLYDGTSGNDEYSIWVGAAGDQTLDFWAEDLDPPGAPTDVFSNTGVSLNVWHHVAATVSQGANGYVRFYLDGISDGGGSVTGTISYASPKLVIGSYPSSGLGYDGELDNVQIYNRSLSSQEILALARNETYKIVSQETTAGQNWTACIISNDGFLDGLTKCSNNITIRGVELSAVSHSALTINSTKINWTTDVTSNTSVNYGTSKSLGTWRKINNDVINHNVTLLGLSSSTRYYYNVSSCKTSVCILKGSYNFTTRSITPSVTTVSINSTNKHNDTNENLTVTWLSTDVDTNRIINITDWRLNGKSLAFLNVPIVNWLLASTNATDFSTFANGCEVNGATIYSTSGHDGGAAYWFDGNDYLRCGDGVDLTKTSGFSVSMWINFTDVATNQILIDNRQISLQFGSGKMSYWHYATPWQQLEGTQVAAAGKWHHLVFQWNKTHQQLYMDGVKNTADKAAATIGLDGADRNLYVGVYSGGTYIQPGFVDDIMIFNRSLSLEQIKLLNASRKTEISSAETDIGDNWTACVTPNDGESNGAAKCSNNITIKTYVPPTPEVAEDHGDGGRAASSEIPAVIPTIVIPEEVQPVVEQPSPVLTTSVTANQIPDSGVVCPQNVLLNKISEETDFSKNIKKGFDVLVSPFKLGCTSQTAQLTFSLPDSYSDVTALRCSAGVCNPVSLSGTNELNCGTPIFDDVKRKMQYLSPDLFPIELTRSEKELNKDVLQSSRTVVKFIGATTGKISMDKLFGPAIEPKNTRIVIVGTPTVLTFENNPVNLDTEATLPYVVPEHVDEYSTALYALKNNQWLYLGGIPNVTSKTVTTKIRDVSQYMENGKLTIVPMGLICLNCIEAKLDKVYDGGSRDAVILVHGFENTPERFEDVINDIKLTNQPWQAWTFGYPSNKPIDDNARVLADLLELHSKEYDFIYIAAHSLGGLVSQQALNYAYEQNKNKGIPPYTFVKKVVKLVSIATPNKGAFSEDLTSVFNFLINNDALAGLFNINSAVIAELIKGKEIPRIPGVEYLVIAGTLPYDFSNLLNVKEKSDGIVTVSSAQTIGGEKVNDYCKNFWTINSTHTDILNIFDSRKIIERIVATEISAEIKNKALLGHSQYYDLYIANCNPDDQYVVVGFPLSREEQPNPGLCNCGNNVCGTDEDEFNCPSDCAKIEKPSIWTLLLNFKPLRNLLISILLISVLIVFLVKKRHKHELIAELKEEEIPKHEEIRVPEKIKPKQLPMPIFAGNISENLDDLLVRTRINLRFGNYSEASILYAKLLKDYESIPLSEKERFKDAIANLKKEIKEKTK